MSISLREFIDTRKTELRKVIAWAEAELRDLESAEKALGTTHGTDRTLGLATETDAAGQVGVLKGTAYLPKFDVRGKLVGKLVRKTIQSMIVDVLTEHPKGLEALEIIALIQERYGRTVARTSMSPQLSRLKADGKLKLTNKTWRLTTHDPPTNNDGNLL